MANSSPIRGLRMRPLVAHVTEVLAGGVASSIESYVQCAGDYDHVVLGHRRRDIQTGDSINLHSAVYELGDSLPLQAWRCRKGLRAIDPDIVHIHSSIAGVYGRLLADRSQPVVFSPHCYSFEAEHRRVATTVLMRQVESRLARRAPIVAAVSQHEREISLQLGADYCAVVPHAFSSEVQESMLSAISFGPSRRTTDVTVVGVGRISGQKDPWLFAAIAAECRRRRLPWKFLWLGGGDTHMTTVLRSAGVEVSGWLSRSDVLKRMSAATALMHTARWEGSPVAFLEAEALGIPVVSLDRAYSRDTAAHLFSSPDEAVALIEEVSAKQPRPWAATEFLEQRAAQGVALSAVYKAALGWSL
jgi:glycosyltransferase involved in cell wall biosynthesis